MRDTGNITCDTFRRGAASGAAERLVSPGLAGASLILATR